MMKSLFALAATSLFAMGTLTGCAVDTSEEAIDETGSEAEPQALVNASNVHCTTGFAYDAASRMCLSGTEALGPFTPVMIAECKKAGGGDKACEGERWARAFAVSVRGKGECPKGATLDKTLGFCAAGSDVYGPFTKTMVDRCKKYGGGPACETTRWARAFVLPKDDPAPPPAPTKNPLQVTYYSQYNDASVSPGASCGNTSASMLLRYLGKSFTPDALRAKYKNSGACGGNYFAWQCPGGLESIYRSEGLFADSTYNASRSTIKRQIDAGRPVVLHGNFTSSGHIVLVVGYDDAKGEFLVHDPAGNWCNPGYDSCGGRGKNAAYAHYKYSSLSASVIGADGNVWISTAGTKPFSF